MQKNNIIPLYINDYQYDKMIKCFIKYNKKFTLINVSEYFNLEKKYVIGFLIRNNIDFDGKRLR